MNDVERQRPAAEVGAGWEVRAGNGGPFMWVAQRNEVIVPGQPEHRFDYFARCQDLRDDAPFLQAWASEPVWSRRTDPGEEDRP